MERGREGGWNKVMSAGVDICRWLDVLWCCDVREWSRATATATFTTRQLDWSQSWPERIDLVARQFGLDCNFTVRMLYRNMYWLLYILDLRFVVFLCTTAVWQFTINEYVMLCYVTTRWLVLHTSASRPYSALIGSSETRAVGAQPFIAVHVVTLRLVHVLLYWLGVSRHDNNLMLHRQLSKLPAKPVAWS